MEREKPFLALKVYGTSNLSNLPTKRGQLQLRSGHVTSFVSLSCSNQLQSCAKASFSLLLTLLGSL